MGKNINNFAVEYVDDILNRYTTDETGESQRKQYKDMTDEQKQNLFENVFFYYMENRKTLDDFDTDLVIWFDYSSY